jgi:phosphatidylinositol alpha-1,6-mannosyltransferase
VDPSLADQKVIDNTILLIEACPIGEKMNDKLRILIVTLDYPPPPGGIQTVVKNLEQGIEELGHICRVLYIDSTKYEWKIRDLVPVPWVMSGFSDLHSREFRYLNVVYRRTKAEITSFNPDVVHAVHIKDWPALLAANQSGVASVLSTHAVELENYSRARKAIELADIVHSPTEFTASLVNDINPNTLTAIIPPPIRVKEYKGAADSTNGSASGPVVTIARFVNRKNIATLLKAWQRLPDTIRDEREFLIVGDGPNRESLEAMAEGQDDIRFLGWVDEVEKRQILARSAVFAMVPTGRGYDVEGFGIVYVEAQAARTPVIGSKHGGVPEAIGDGGLIVEDERDPEAVAVAMERLLDDDEAREELLAAAARRIDRFDIQVVSTEHIGVYNRLVAENS